MPLSLSSRLAQFILVRSSSCCLRQYALQASSNRSSPGRLTIAAGIGSRPAGGRTNEELLQPLKCLLVPQGSDSVTTKFETIRQVEILLRNEMNSGNRLMTVMSYNVLAQDLILMNRALYAQHSPDALKWDYRKRLLMQQILLTNPDILSLQEVQESHIESFYSNLENNGYRGLFKKRTALDKTDGCAIYYKQSVFELMNHTTVEFNQPGIPLLNRPNVAIVMRLRHRATDRDVIVANTHLLFNPKRWDVRLAQTQVLLAEFDRILKTSNQKQPACLFMGDFNSHPGSPVVTLLTRGQFETEKRILPDSLGITRSSLHQDKSKLYNSDRLLSDEPDTCSSRVKEQGECSKEGSPEDRNPSFKYRKDVRPNLITHGFNFTSTYDLDTRRLVQATTFQYEWLTVDYIFYSDLKLVSRLRLPTAGECYSYIGPIPNQFSPSDHFPLVATYAL